jgi:putative ABC transport system substrate-binding protein
VDKTQAFKIGISQFVTHPALDATVEGFKAALTDAGFTNITYDLQNAQADMATTSTIAQKFAGENLDLILGVATPSSQALAKAITTTPIVFSAVTDPVGAGLVTDVAAPNAYVTGVSDMQPVEPVLDLVKQLKPGATTVGAIYNAGEANSVFLVKAEKKYAPTVGLKIVDATAGTSAEVQAAAQSLIGRVDAITVIGDNTAVSAFESIVKVCNENGIVLLAGDPDSVKRGAAAGYGFDYTTVGKEAGMLAAQILSGTPVADVPVVFVKDKPQNLQLSVNEKAAQAQGVTIPADLLSQAVNKF